MKICLLRHCEVKKNTSKGYNLDLLTRDGRLAAISITNTVPFAINHILASPFYRTKCTAQIIAKRKGLPVTINKNWIEISRGIFTTRPYQDFLDDWAGSNFDYDYIPKNGESVNHGRKRIIKGIDDIIALEENTLCVTHASLIANLLMMLYGFEFELAKPPFGGFCNLTFDRTNFLLESSNYLNFNRQLKAPYFLLNNFR